MDVKEEIAKQLGYLIISNVEQAATIQKLQSDLKALQEAQSKAKEVSNDSKLDN